LYASFIATAVPRNITLIYRTISGGSEVMPPAVNFNMWRNGTFINPGINPGIPFMWQMATMWILSTVF
jgi:hypothetical protein